jgi:glycosyltransferase involved in cell wall biosynthesis
VIEPGTAVLVPPRDPVALADAVVALLGDEERRGQIGAAARKLAVERYSWDRIATRLAEIYEEVAA